MLLRGGLLLLLAAMMAGAQEKKLAIAEARLLSYDDGPAIKDTETLGPGDGVWVSARIAGFAVKVDEDKDRRFIHLTYRFEAVDPDGVAVAEAKSGKIETDLAREDKNWMPKERYNFVLPPLPETGAHKVILTVTDEFSKTTARRELPFRVKGWDVPASPTLVARGFRFQRREEEGAPLSPARYKPGDTVWARFEMTGYKIGERNAIDVAYGLEVLRASDQKSMYAEPNAAREKDATFYRKRYMQGALSLNLNADIAKGDYIVILKLRDEVGAQTHEERHTFTVE